MLSTASYCPLPIADRRLLRIGNRKSEIGNRKSAFTLVEVLVVISVISILLGLLYAGVRASLQGSHAQNTRTIVNEVGMAITSFYNMQSRYPAGEYTGTSFSNPALVKQLGSLLQARSSTFVDTDNDNKLDTVVDAWGRPLIYTRYVLNQGDPGADNHEDGIQPLYNPKTYDLFSTGAYADRIAGLTGAGSTVQTEALKITNGKYTHDGEKVKAGSKTTGEINVYYGNW